MRLAPSAFAAVSRNFVPSAVMAAACALVPVAAARADRLDDVLRLVPADAVSALVVPSVKSASDDLQLAIDRMGKAEAALGGRPIDLLKAQLGIGAGFDDRGAFVVWSVARGTGLASVAAFPVTDADAFVAGSFVDAPELGAGAMRARSSPQALWVRKAGKHVLVADAADAAAGWEEKDGFAAVLAKRLDRRGMDIVRTADGFAWASEPVLKRLADIARTQGEIDETAARMLPRTKDEAGPAAALETVARGRERGAQILSQLTDGVVTIDFDALALGIRAFARFAPGSELAQAIPTAAAGTRDVQQLLSRLPDAAFYGALGIDLRSMGGLAHVRRFLDTIPGNDRMRLPEWLDRVQDKVDQVQVAAYPSKLGIAVGGILNDASFVVATSDPAAVKAGLKSWIMAQAGENDGIRSEPSWEDERALKDGSKVSAFAVKETATGPGADITQRLLKQFIVSNRGLHGFAREVPGALVVTYSQRTDVLDRATAAAAGTAKKTLAANGMVRAMSPWLVPDADVVVFVGVGQLLGAARQVAESLPGGGAEMLPAAPEGLEPVGFAERSRNGTWETAVVIPSGVLGLAFDAAKARALQGQPAPAPRAPSPAPAGAPAANAP